MKSILTVWIALMLVSCASNAAKNDSTRSEASTLLKQICSSCTVANDPDSVQLSDFKPKFIQVVCTKDKLQLTSIPRVDFCAVFSESGKPIALKFPSEQVIDGFRLNYINLKNGFPVFPKWRADAQKVFSKTEVRIKEMSSDGQVEEWINTKPLSICGLEIPIDSSFTFDTEAIQLWPPVDLFFKGKRLSARGGIPLTSNGECWGLTEDNIPEDGLFE